MGKVGEKASNLEPCVRVRPMAMDFEHLMIWDISCYIISFDLNRMNGG